MHVADGDDAGVRVGVRVDPEHAELLAARRERAREPAATEWSPPSVSTKRPAPARAAAISRHAAPTAAECRASPAAPPAPAPAPARARVAAILRASRARGAPEGLASRNSDGALGAPSGCPSESRAPITATVGGAMHGGGACVGPAGAAGRRVRAGGRQASRLGARRARRRALLASSRSRIERTFPPSFRARPKSSARAAAPVRATVRTRSLNMKVINPPAPD